MICKKCGHLLDESNLFCPHCGAKVVADIPQVAPNTPFAQGGQGATRHNVENPVPPVSKEKERPKRHFQFEEIDWNLDGYPTDEKKETDAIDFNWESVVDHHVDKPGKEPPEQAEALGKIRPEMPEKSQNVQPVEARKVVESARLDQQEKTAQSIEEVIFGTRDRNGNISETQRFDSSADIGSTTRMDKFYTYNKKNEEFQALLDKEYNRLKSQLGVDYRAPEETEESGENPIFEAPGFGTAGEVSQEPTRVFDPAAFDAAPVFQPPAFAPAETFGMDSQEEPVETPAFAMPAFEIPTSQEEPQEEVVPAFEVPVEGPAPQAEPSMAGMPAFDLPETQEEPAAEPAFEMPEMPVFDFSAEPVADVPAEETQEVVVPDFMRTEPEAPAFEMPQAPVEPEVPAFEMPQAPVEAEAPAFEMPQAPAEPEAPAFEMPQAPVEPEAPAFEMPQAPVEPEVPAFEMPQAPAEPEVVDFAAPQTPEGYFPEAPTEPETPAFASPVFEAPQEQPAAAPQADPFTVAATSQEESFVQQETTSVAAPEEDPFVPTISEENAAEIEKMIREDVAGGVPAEDNKITFQDVFKDELEEEAKAKAKKPRKYLGLKIFAIILLVLIVLELVVIGIKWGFPDSAASVWLQNLFNGVYNGLSSIFG